LGFAPEVAGEYQEVLRTLERKGDFKNGVLKVNNPRNHFKTDKMTMAAASCSRKPVRGRSNGGSPGGVF